MGMYVSETGAQPRRKIVTITASDPSFSVPDWAQNGKSLVLVSGCAAGASGAISATAGQRGQAGGSGAQCTNLPLLIATGISTIGIVIGAPGTAVSASVATPGVAGGDTIVTVGSQSVTLKGGSTALSAAYVNLPSNVTTSTANGPTPASPTATNGQDHFYDALLHRGNLGGSGTAATQPDAFGAGASTFWGRGGDGLTSTPANGAVGANATGYGSGGAGANCTGPTATTSGAGTGGVVILEFVEGL